MPFSHNGLKTTTGIYRYTAVKRFTGEYIHSVLPILYGNVHGCVFAKNRPVALNWSDYTYRYRGWGLRRGRGTKGMHLYILLNLFRVPHELEKRQSMRAQKLKQNKLFKFNKIKGSHIKFDEDKTLEKRN